MVVEYTQSDRTVTVFGLGMIAGPLAGATGQINRGWHSKCYWIVRKAAVHGDATAGRLIADGPTGYDHDDLACTPEEYTAMGLTPAQAAAEGTQSLLARVRQIRAVARQIGKPVGHPEVTAAVNALADTQRARAADPGYQEPREADWRHQTAIDVGEL